MKIFYLSRARIPSHKAHVLQIHKMCDAFRQAGATVELFHPREPADSPEPDKLREDYDLSGPLTYRTIPCLNLKWLRNNTARLGFLLYAGTYCFVGLLILLWSYYRSSEPAVVYSRDRVFSYLMLYLKPFLRIPVYLELHEIPESFQNDVAPGLARRANGVVVISEAIKEDLTGLGFSESQILVEPDAVDPGSFEINKPKDDIRSELGLPTEDSIVGFTGNLYSYNGPEVILRVAERCPEITFVIVGGSEKQLEQFRRKKNKAGLDNLHFEGYRPHRQIPLYLKAFDVLLLPLEPRIDRTRKYCSPLKLFEYLMAGRPIVASDLPSLREVLENGENSLLVEPGDADAFKTAVKKILDDPKLAQKLAHNAKRTGTRYSWENRAENILGFVQELTNP